MKVKTKYLKVGDVISDVPYGHKGEKHFNASVKRIDIVYDPITFEEVNAVIVKQFCIRDNGTVFHVERAITEQNKEWELLFREDETEDVG